MKGMDLSIHNLDKLSVKKFEELMTLDCMINEKIDGTKLTLVRTNSEYDSANYEKNWIVAFKGNILRAEEFAGVDPTQVNDSIGISQYTIVFSHLKNINKQIAEIPKSTEFFIEFAQRKPTITRDYTKLTPSNRLFLIAWSPTEYEVHENMLESRASTFNKDTNRFARVLSILTPKVVFRGKLDSLKTIQEGIRDPLLVKSFEAMRPTADYGTIDEQKAFLMKLFISFESQLGGKPEGVVINTEDMTVKIVQPDQYDKETRADLRAKWKEDNEVEEDTYWQKLIALSEKMIHELKSNDKVAEYAKKVYSLKIEDFQDASIKHSKKKLINLKDDLYVTGKNRIVNMIQTKWNALIIGRYQPITLGHKKMIDQALAMKDVSNVVIGIVKGMKTSEKMENPFSLKTQTRLIEKVYKGEKRIRILEVPTANVKSALRGIPYKIKYVLCGDDRKDMYEKQLADMPNIQLIAVSRDGISATKARNALDADDFEEFKKTVPKEIYDEFGLLKSEIESHYE